MVLVTSIPASFYVILCSYSQVVFLVPCSCVDTYVYNIWDTFYINHALCIYTLYLCTAYVLYYSHSILKIETFYR